MLKPTLKLTALMEASVQGERSTLSHIPDRLQVLLTMVVVSGHWRVWVVPARVSGQERNSVVSALHPLVTACVCVRKARVIKTQKSYM